MEDDREGREREKRQLLIESEFEETQKKGEKEKWEKEGKLPWKSEGGCANSIRKEGRGERWVIIEKIDPSDFWLLVECLADSWEGRGEGMKEGAEMISTFRETIGGREGGGGRFKVAGLFSAATAAVTAASVCFASGGGGLGF